MKNTRRKVRLAIVAAIALSVIGVPVAAQATSQAPTASVASLNVTTGAAAISGDHVPIRIDDPSANYDTTSDQITSKYTRNGYLPLNRWFLASTTFHDEFDSFITKQLTEKTMRGTVQTLGMMGGNTAWFSTGEIVRFATTFDVLGNQVGAAADHAAGLIGSTLTTNPLLIGSVLTLIVASILWQAWRKRAAGGGPWRRAGGVIVVLALMTVMSAAASTGKPVTSADNVTTYTPPTGSPVWAATVVSDAVSRFAAVPAAAMVDWGSTTAASTGGPYSCDAYTAAMSTKGNTMAAGANTNVVAVTKVINSLWQTTGLATWKVAQFGGDNTYGDFMYCRALDQQAPIVSAGNANFLTRSSELGFSSTGATPGTKGARSPIFTTFDNGDFDKTMIAWASCRPATVRPSGPSSFMIASGWSKKKDNSAWIAPTDCWNWWSASNPGDIPSAFDINGSASDIQDLTADARVLDFVNALHGSSLGAIATGTVAIGSYNIAAFFMTLVFLGLALAVIIAKTYAIVLVMLLFIVMIVSLFARTSAIERLTPLLHKFLGITVFSFGISIILSLIAVLTKMLIDIGNGLGGAGNPVTLLWAGAAPLISLLLLHNIFTKVIKMPSPLSPRGALAWGTAGGAAGAAIGTGIANRIQNRATGAARGIAKRGANAALSKATGGRLGTGGRPGTGGAASRHTMDGGPRRGDVQGLSEEAMQSTAAQQAAGVAARKTAIAEHRAENPNAARRATRQLGGKVATAVGRWTAGSRNAALAVDRYMGGSAVERAAMRASANERLRVGLAAVHTHAANAGRRLISAPYDARTAIDSASTAVYGAGARTVSATQRAAQELRQHGQDIRQHPGQAVGAVTRGIWNGTKAAAHSPVAKRAVRVAAVAGAISLGPIGAVAAGGYLAVKGRNAVAARRVKQDAIVAAYTEKKKAESEQSQAAKAKAASEQEQAAGAAAPVTKNEIEKR